VQLLVKKASDACAKPRGRGVWVPAFAGTTMSSRPAFGLLTMTID
jgi:hypothetical protein